MKYIITENQLTKLIPVVQSRIDSSLNDLKAMDETGELENWVYGNAASNSTDISHIEVTNVEKDKPNRIWVDVNIYTMSLRGEFEDVVDSIEARIKPLFGRLFINQTIIRTREEK
jgi:hypothetical protein